ncbi:MAG: thioredoxin family protein, partial [Kiritimatiellaceae bacterium]|nr:thioredoxin family protein [Kiritimatiellaceae bacterium]
EVLEHIEQEVKVTLFTQEKDCELCGPTQQMIEEISGLSDKISLSVRDLSAEADEAEKYGVDKVPALILEGDKDYGIRFYGIPAGHEFTTLIEDIMSVSQRHHGLSDEVMSEISKVDQPVHIQVIVSPQCPYCPQVVRSAHRFAMANEHIRSDMVESAEFSDLTEKYHVHGVPHTVINEEHQIIGPASEIELVREVLKAIGKEPAVGEKNGKEQK